MISRAGSACLKLPESVLTTAEHLEFRTLLKELLQSIDDKIILEQKNLSREQKDYIISFKKGNGTLTHAPEDHFFSVWEFEALSCFILSSEIISC